MRSRPFIALAVAAVATALAGLTWWVAFRTGAGNRADLAVIGDLSRLESTRLLTPMNVVVRLCNTGPFAALALLVIAAAVVTRGRRDAVVIAAVLFAPNAVTQVLKRLTAADRVPGTQLQIVEAQSWPSGHATAALVLALCAVAVAPSAWRMLVAVAGAAFALAVGFSAVALTWHFPSDVIGGYCVAIAAAALAVAVTGGREAGTRRPRLAAGLPERLVGAVRRPGEDEEQVREPVEVAHGLR